MLVTLNDPFAILPANRDRVDRLRAEAAGRGPEYVPGRYVGWFGGATVDDRREALAELGYMVGRAQGRVTHSTVSGTSWAASANPVRPLWLTYAQHWSGPARVAARLAVPGGWVAADYGDRRLDLEGAARLGRIVIYGSTRDRFAVTWRGGVDVQVGHSGERSAVRVSFGPIDPSPISTPMVY